MSTVLVNDWHSELNATRVAEVVTPASLDAAQEFVARSARDGRALSLCGGRHAMGGQQFLTDGNLLDTSSLNRVLAFDPAAGTIEVEAGIQWTELVEWLLRNQEGRSPQWGILQKQTGVDAVSLGGSLAANIHSRGLTMQPFGSDVLELTLIDPAGNLRRCSRELEPDLFRLVTGGYGLFGLVYSIKLRLGRRRKVERVVRMARTPELLEAFEERIADGYAYGDFQYSCDEGDTDRFMREGVFPCYRAVPDDTPEPDGQLTLDEEQWRELVCWGHVDKARAYREYAEYYLASSGQIYWSDTHQLIPYDRGYHALLDARLGAKHRGSEMIAEAFVPRGALVPFMEAVRADFLEHGTNPVYGTIRLIERDKESFLAWAREPWICIIFNLHVDHTEEGISRARDAFRRLIDRSIALGGSYYPTYHRWATREQVLTCFRQFPEFLLRKQQWDPAERFSSDWYRHHCALLGVGR